ncbi:hypothetical protein GQ600_12890 [Phytophthora cactorum]|nr:hypothetical protein GQ600_12890 [Phytophthora cactorum]
MLRDFLGRSIQGRPIDSKRDGTTDDGAELPDITDVNLPHVHFWVHILYRCVSNDICRGAPYIKTGSAVLLPVKRFQTGGRNIQRGSVQRTVHLECLQVASTQASTVTIMAVDLLHFWLSMYDVVEILKQVKVLMNKIPEGIQLAKKTFCRWRCGYWILKPSTYVSHLSHPTWKDQIESWVNSNVPATKRNERRMSEFGHDEVNEKSPSQTRKPSLGTRVSLSPQVKFKDGYKPSVAYLRP